MLDLSGISQELKKSRWMCFVSMAKTGEMGSMALELLPFLIS